MGRDAKAPSTSAPFTSKMGCMGKDCGVIASWALLKSALRLASSGFDVTSEGASRDLGRASRDLGNFVLGLRENRGFTVYAVVRAEVAKEEKDLERGPCSHELIS